MAGLRLRCTGHRAWRSDGGFSVVELSVAISVLLVGVLGTVALVDGAGAATDGNRAREGATALAREIVEVTRALEYEQLTAAGIEAGLQARPGLADASGAPGYTLRRRGFTYTVSVGACAVDDAKDALGSHGGAVTFCPESSATGSVDRNPDDYRRVTVTLSWRAGGRDESGRQTALITNPAGGLGPSVKDLQPVAPASATITDPALASATFDVDTSSTPASLEWYVNGAPQGTATGSGTDWGFTWPLGGVLDGTYLVQARAFNEEGRSGVARVVTVVLNRFRPLAPSGVGAGRNGNGDHVDVEWHANGEADVIGYRVWRLSATGGPAERACPPAASSQSFVEGALSCVDEAAPATGVPQYAVVALDRDPAGDVAEGAQAVVGVAEGNAPPAAPGGLSACAGGAQGCNDPQGEPAPAGTTVLTWDPATDPDSGDSVRFYRIYRDGTGYGARYDRLYATGSPLVWVDDATGGQPHEYRVSAVDERFGESPLEGPVSG